MTADYPFHFINSVVNEFQKDKKCEDESLIIPSRLFEITKPSVPTEMPQCELNQI